VCPYLYILITSNISSYMLLPFEDWGFKKVVKGFPLPLWRLGGALPPRLSQYNVVLAVVGERFDVAAVFGL